MREDTLSDYTRLLQRLKFNIDAARSAIESGEYQSPAELEALQVYVRGLIDSVSKYQVAKEVFEKETLTDDDVRKAMSITCYGDLAYCCGLTKECPWRDACLQALRIDHDTYADVKKGLIRELLIEADRRKSQGMSSGAASG